MKTVCADQAESDAANLPAQILGVTPGPNGSALTMSPGTGLRSFTLDHVFSADASQADVFETTGLPCAWDFVNG